ncbi:unnamed protein product [Protopolystoma xenopodis]|uniref:Uncharacterized protein n=1 Tax=Protopolystoma xenopodis TaxID=117903 RepID=A0A3S5B2E4_9PLAT|nr:unnamed protein product [Protopolystoma xenopodis]
MSKSGLTSFLQLVRVFRNTYLDAPCPNFFAIEVITITSIGPSTRYIPSRFAGIFKVAYASDLLSSILPKHLQSSNQLAPPNLPLGDTAPASEACQIASSSASEAVAETRSVLTAVNTNIGAVFNQGSSSPNSVNLIIQGQHQNSDSTYLGVVPEAGTNFSEAQQQLLASAESGRERSVIASEGNDSHNGCSAIQASQPCGQNLSAAGTGVSGERPLNAQETNSESTVYDSDK